jgi:hypothetical protein
MLAGTILSAVGLVTCRSTTFKWNPVTPAIRQRGHIKAAENVARKSRVRVVDRIPLSGMQFRSQWRHQ